MGFLVTGHMQVEMRFDELRRAMAISLNKAAAEWAAVALEEVRAAETRVGTASPNRKVSPGVHLKDTFQVAVIQRTRGFGLNAIDAVVYSTSENAIWQELGTRGRRRKTLKSGGKPDKGAGGNRGVAPLYFMRTGLRRSFPVGLALIEKALSSIEVLGGSKLVDTSSPDYFNSGSSKFLGGR